jgi:hypothetical protein
MAKDNENIPKASAPEIETLTERFKPFSYLYYFPSSLW